MQGCIVKIDNGEEKTDYADVVIIEYLDLKEGSFWIMKDSLSGQVDSFAINSYDINKMYDISTKRTAQLKSYYIHQYNPAHGSGPYAYWYTLLAPQRHESPTYFKNDTTGELLGKHNLQASTSNLLPTYSVNGQTYSDVLVWHFSDFDLYVHKKAGFIKMRHHKTNLNAVWELERSHIVR